MNNAPYRLHYNKSTKMFTARDTNRQIVCVSERGAKLPTIGDTVRLSQSSFLIVTHNDYLKAITSKRCRPVLNVAQTRFPFVAYIKLLWVRLKEAF